MSTDESATPAADDREQEVDPPAAVPDGPPWPVDVIADLHAGRYPAEVAGELRRRITADPWAASVSSALDATVDDLSLLPVPRMPERFALRLDAAVTGEYRAAAAARGVTVGTDAAAPGATMDQSVPLPRQAVDQSLSAVRGRDEQFGGQSGAGQSGAGQQLGAQKGSGPSGLQGRPPPAGPQGPPIPRPGAPADSAPEVGPTGSSASHPSNVPPTQPPAPDRSAGGPVAFTALPPGVRSLDAARAKRRRWIGGLAAAAAVVAIGTASVVSLQHPTSTAGASGTAVVPAPAPGSGANALELDPGRFAEALEQIEGKRPVGPLQDAATYSSCLAANSIDPSAVLGVTSATFRGKPAAAIAVRIDAASTKVVVVGPHCGIQGAADQLASETVTS